MRVTNQLVARQNLQNYQFGSQSIYDLNDKLASKMKITQPYEDTGIYLDATRLEYENTVLEQVQEATTKAGEFAKNTDSTLNDFTDALTTFKTKLIQAANEGEHNVTSREAIANDLQALRDQLVTISNTAINGQYLFSGTAITTKPISSDGKYHGNDQNITVAAGTGENIPYNIDGVGLFLGRDNDYEKQISTNITLINAHEELNAQSPETWMKQTDNIYKLIGTNYQSAAKNEQGKMDYMNDFSTADVADLPPTVFFMQGQRPNGESFSVKFELTADATIDDLMQQMGQAMGNTTTNQVVEVTLNKNSQIQMTNLKNGNEIMSFSLFGLTEMKGTDEQEAAKAAGDPDHLLSATEIAGLQSQAAVDYVVSNNLAHLTSFISSPSYNDENGTKITNVDYDQVRFEKKGNVIQSNASQIVRSDNSFATDSTRLSEVAALSTGLTNAVGANGGAVTSLKDADNLILDIVGRRGNKLKATIDFNGTITGAGTADEKTYPTITITDEAGTTKYSGNFYKIEWNETLDPADPTKQIGNEAKMVETDDLSFKEINDMLTILANGDLDRLDGVTEKIDGTATQTELNEAYERFSQSLDLASRSIETTMDHRGLITINDKTTSVSNVEIAMYQDHQGKDYPAGVGTDMAQSGGVLSFMKNDAIIIDRPSIDFFADLDDMILAVRDGSYFGNPNGNNHRTSGIQGAIERLDHIMDHVNKEHAIAGTNSLHISNTYERATMLSLNVQAVKSDVIDADYGEIMMKFQERLLAYQAMLQATSKISNISLLNYM